MLISLSTLVFTKPFLPREIRGRFGITVAHLDMYRMQGTKLPLVEVEDPELIYEIEKIMGCQMHAEAY